jgi:hypothetical protein
MFKSKSSVDPLIHFDSLKLYFVHSINFKYRIRLFFCYLKKTKILKEFLSVGIQSIYINNKNIKQGEALNFFINNFNFSNSIQLWEI